MIRSIRKRKFTEKRRNFGGFEIPFSDIFSCDLEGSFWEWNGGWRKFFSTTWSCVRFISRVGERMYFFPASKSEEASWGVEGEGKKCEFCVLGKYPSFRKILNHLTSGKGLEGGKSTRETLQRRTGLIASKGITFIFPKSRRKMSWSDNAGVFFFVKS